MRYLCLTYLDEVEAGALSANERNALTSAAAEYAEELAESGRSIASAALAPSEMAATIGLRYGKLWIAEGPLAGTKEQLVGFFLVEARDLNDAIRMASKIPSLHLGCIEVWPIKE